MKSPRLLLCTDLDRTLLPNGSQTESAQARRLFSRLIEHEAVTLVYVTGRHQELVEEAILTWQIPVPHFLITDVGTRIQHVHDGQWHDWKEWKHHIATDWAGLCWPDLHKALQDLTELRLQEEEKQNRCKLSYYVPLDTVTDGLEPRIHKRLATLGVKAALVWSIDEQAATGLLDILPYSAGKYAAIHSLIQELGYQLPETVFAGDSGNDLEVLASSIPAVLVANASPEVRKSALQAARQAGTGPALYLAQGNFLGMNGNYSAGIVEGVIHYRPELLAWLEQTSQAEP